MKRELLWSLVIPVALLAGPADASKRSPADQALYERAKKACNNLRLYPDGAKIIINYKDGWYRCQESKKPKRH
jgi:hypothetical protein